MGGCQTGPGGITQRDVQPMVDYFGNARSLALSTQPIHAAQAYPSAFAPWYSGRNDVVPYVVSGYNASTYERSVTTTYDGQYSAGSRVRDRFIQTTRRTTYRESSR